MPIIELTAKTLRELRPSDGKRSEYFDANLPGFSVRVSPSGKKTFSVLYRCGTGFPACLPPFETFLWRLNLALIVAGGKNDLNTIRFAGADRLCVDLSYTYQRRSGTGPLLTCPARLTRAVLGTARLRVSPYYFPIVTF
ncbi:MAG: DUF4102 domain-containing protein [Acidobacteria bacterium]|nr:MAG: DUF4102 domain-containing protein [Acidobacteriota bacterium]